MTDFATAMQLTPTGDLRWAADLPADWSQGRTMFGGLIGALAARVATLVVGAERPLRTLDVAFVAPLPPGPVEIDVEVLASGRAVTQLVVSVRSAAGTLGARVHVVTGAGRVSALRVAAGPSVITEGDPGEQGLALPYVPGLSPQYQRQFEFRWCSPDLPYSGGGPDAALLNGWARHRTPALGLEAVIALLDAWPPVILPMLATHSPVSTVRWAIHLSPEAGVEEAMPDGFDADQQWAWYEARTVQCADGYATASAAMFSGGRLLAWSEQLITVYDKPAPDVPAALDPAVVGEGSPA